MAKATKDIVQAGKIIRQGEDLPEGYKEPKTDEPTDTIVGAATVKPGTSGSGEPMPEGAGVAADGSFDHTKDGQPSGVAMRSADAEPKSKKKKSAKSE